ncbi:MAG: PEP-CTERM sorting domain-containing protein [Verrucomicrobiota bacterium]
MKLLAPLLALTALASTANAAIYYDTRTYYSNTIDVGSSSVNIFDVAKFNIPQATLTGVTVKVVQSTFNGSITVTNQGSITAQVNQFNASFIASQFTSGLGYAQTTANLTNVVTSPNWASTNLQPNTAQNFNIASGQTFVVADQNISSGFFGAYTGAGNVTFSASNPRVVTITGDDGRFQTANAKTTTQFAIVYSFSIPEPSTALLGGLASILLFRRRR